MSGGDLDLARRLAAHPRYPGHDEPDHVTSGTGGYPQGRLWNGLLLRHQPAGVGNEWWWLPVLDDAATGGILASWMPPGTRFDHVFGPDEDGGTREHWLVAFDGIVDSGPTIGEAAARALLALWGPA